MAQGGFGRTRKSFRWARGLALAWACAGVAASACGGAATTGPTSGRREPVPPVAPKHPVKIEQHGQVRVDDFAWLRQRDNPEVLAYLRAENAYTEAVLAPQRALEDRLYAEIVGRIEETDTTPPVRQGAFLYESRTEKGKQYPAYFRAPVAEPTRYEPLLDLNELAKGESFLDVDVMEPSDDGRLLAYTVDVKGFREYTLRVLDLGSRQLLPERIEHVTSAAWAADGKTLLYAVEDDAKRPHRVYRHVLGSREPDALVYEEKDERFVVHVWRSRSKRFLHIGAMSHTTSEVRYVPANDPTAMPIAIAERRAEHEYEVEDQGDRFYVRTNDRCRTFRVVTAPVATAGQASSETSWQELVPCADGVMREGLQVFDTFFVLSEREAGIPQLRVAALDGAGAHRIPMPEPVYEVYPDDNPEPDTTRFRFTYQSLTTPRTWYEYAVDGGQLERLKVTRVLGGYDASRYRTERLMARAKDGTEVPISLVLPANREPGPIPVVLTGYGAYGYPLGATFSYSRVSLLERGVGYAIAHVRGGGELGKPWHDQGRMANKHNTFGDFVACAEHLIAAGYTRPDLLAIEGGSAGGLLVGAVLNQRPELFRAALLDVPFVDVLNTMSDATLPLTVGEYEEWGNPTLPDQYRQMAAYSPYDNLARQAYPAMLVKTSYEDSQVMYWEPAKYVAKLRTLKTDTRPLLLWVNMAGGHGGSSGRYAQWRERAFDLAFFLWQLGR
jgi:oligopeptidase B